MFEVFVNAISIQIPNLVDAFYKCDGFAIKF